MSPFNGEKHAQFCEKWHIIISQKRKIRLGLRELLKESEGKKKYNEAKGRLRNDRSLERR